MEKKELRQKNKELLVEYKDLVTKMIANREERKNIREQLKTVSA